MKQKFSTLLDPALFRQLKLEAVVRGKQINELVAEALRLYLEQQHRSQSTGSVVASSWGALAADPRTVAKIMEEEDGILDA